MSPSRLEGELPHHSSYFSHASLLTCTTQKVVEPLIFVNMDLEYRQFKLLVRYLYTCDPLIAHPTHRTICLSITGLSTPPLGSDRYDLSSLFTFMPNLQFLYAPSVLSRSQELVGIAYHSHPLALPDWGVCDSWISPSIATQANLSTTHTTYSAFGGRSARESGAAPMHLSRSSESGRHLMVLPVAICTPAHLWHSGQQVARDRHRCIRHSQGHTGVHGSTSLDHGS
jgi:hypothetical protein